MCTAYMYDQPTFISAYMLHVAYVVGFRVISKPVFFWFEFTNRASLSIRVRAAKCAKHQEFWKNLIVYFRDRKTIAYKD